MQNVQQKLTKIIKLEWDHFKMQSIFVVSIVEKQFDNKSIYVNVLLESAMKAWNIPVQPWTCSWSLCKTRDMRKHWTEHITPLISLVSLIPHVLDGKRKRFYKEYILVRRIKISNTQLYVQTCKLSTNWYQYEYFRKNTWFYLSKKKLDWYLPPLSLMRLHPAFIWPQPVEDCPSVVRLWFDK